jgi:hypothetical protein
MLALSGLQHGKRFSHTGGVAKENPQFATLSTRRLLSHASQYLVRIWAVVVHFRRENILVGVDLH